jgi:hypothetical protein
MSKTIPTRITDDSIIYGVFSAIICILLVSLSMHLTKLRDLRNALELDENAVAELKALKAEQCGDNPCQVSISFEPK